MTTRPPITNATAAARQKAVKRQIIEEVTQASTNQAFARLMEKADSLQNVKVPDVKVIGGTSPPFPSRVVLVHRYEAPLGTAFCWGFGFALGVSVLSVVWLLGWLFFALVMGLGVLGMA